MKRVTESSIKKRSAMLTRIVKVLFVTVFFMLLFSSVGSAQLKLRGIAVQTGYAVADQGVFGVNTEVKLGKTTRFDPSAKFFFGNNTEFSIGLDFRFFYHGSSSLITGAELGTGGINLNLGFGTEFPLRGRSCFLDATFGLPDEENYVAKFVFGVYVF